jgi:hypothetical protein
MGTRANIGILNRDGTVTAIYTHWDGYPDHHGPILLGSYATEGRVRELIALGDLSVLGRKLGEQHDFNSHDNDGDDCLAYHRDRGEKWEGVKPVDFDSEDTFSRGFGGADYVYLWKDGAWHWCAAREYSPEAQLRPLTRQDCRIAS